MAIDYSVFKQLTIDVLAAENILSSDPESDFGRRTYIRTIVALIEADLYSLQDRLLNWMVELIPFQEDIPIFDVCALMNSSVAIDDSGKAVGRKLNHTVPQLCKYLFHQFGELALYDTSALFEGEGWENFKWLFKVRNRITHPKKTEDIIVEDRDLEAAKDAKRWYLSTLDRLHAKKKENGIQIE